MVGINSGFNNSAINNNQHFAFNNPFSNNASQFYYNYNQFNNGNVYNNNIIGIDALEPDGDAIVFQNQSSKVSFKM